MIALDAMGGDNAPAVVVKGAEIARGRYPDVDFMFVGNESQLVPMLQRLPELQLRSTIRHTEELITNDIKPSIALRQGRNSSMQRSIDAVREGVAEGVVSAGNTGALMAMAMVALRTLPGIDRPAIASLWPTERAESLVLDLGANIECDADNLVQFAVMGEVFARTALGLSRPTVGLLNVGSEDLKGHEALQQAAATLKGVDLALKFHGFIEGDDIPAGTVDVVVTDGFTGNVALKTAEGTVRFYTNALRRAFKNNLFSRLGYLMLMPALAKIRSQLDPRYYNGAVFLGLNGIVVKSHGGTDEIGFANAIGVAVDMAVHRFNENIIKELESMNSGLTARSHAAAS